MLTGGFISEYNQSVNKQSLFNRQIALPQDHGSWVLILSPLLIGIFASRAFS